MSSETAPEQRLHPLSFVFLMLVHLRQYALPLVLGLFVGRRPGNDYDRYALVGVAVMALYSLAQYFSFRYRLEADAVVVRSGVFERSLRHIPFARIQNVSLHQNVLHRLFRVAEVRLESAGSDKPEANMRVLRLRDAQVLESKIRAGGRGARASGATSAVAAGEAPAVHTLLALSVPEVLRLGLISNRGMFIVAGGFAALAQMGDNLIGRLFAAVGNWLTGHAGDLHFSWLVIGGAALALFLAVLMCLRLLSTAWALLRFYGFRLSESEGRLSMERGLFTRVRATLPAHRIQAWTMHEGVLHRWFGRRSLRVDSAVVESGLGEKHSLRDLAPIATPAVIDALVDGLLPQPAWPLHDWQPLHPNAWRRKFTIPALLLLLVVVALAIWRSPQALWLLLALPVLWWRAHNWAKYSAWAIADGMVAFRGGWLARHWRFAETHKLQAVEWQQSPFDRRHGMATLHFDTAGASGMEPALAIPYLPEATARRIYEELSLALR
ncbi:MAG: PH domain-containing protein [Arenimonas sp.]